MTTWNRSVNSHTRLTRRSVYPAGFGGLVFHMSAKHGAAALDGSSGTAWDEIVGADALEASGASLNPTYELEGWGTNLPAVRFTAANGQRVRDGDNFDGSAIFPANFTVMMALDNNEPTSGGLKWILGSEDDSCVPFQLFDDEWKVRVGATADNIFSNGNRDLSGKGLYVLTVAGTVANGWHGNTTSVAAGDQNPATVGSGRPSASDGIVIGSSWAGANDMDSKLAEVCIWNKVLAAAQINALARKHFRAEWGDVFGEWRL